MIDKSISKKKINNQEGKIKTKWNLNIYGNNKWKIIWIKAEGELRLFFFWARFDCALRNGFCSEQSPAHAAVAVDCRCYRFVVPFRFIPFSGTQNSARESEAVWARESAMECKQLWVESVFKRLLKRCLCVRVCVQAALSRSLFEWECYSQLSATAAWADRRHHAQQQQIGAAHTHMYWVATLTHSHSACALSFSLSLERLF